MQRLEEEEAEESNMNAYRTVFLNTFSLLKIYFFKLLWSQKEGNSGLFNIITILW
jgi:hypothetical protein